MPVSHLSASSEESATERDLSLGDADPEKPSDAETENSFIASGLPIPSSYDVDMVRAMVQNPFRLYVYWEMRDRSFDMLAHYFSPEEVAAFQVVLRLVESRTQAEAFFEAEKRGNRWITVSPDREYEFEIGVRSDVHGYIALAHSNRLRTPRITISTEPPAESACKQETPEFNEVIEASGFSEWMGDLLRPLNLASDLFTEATESLSRPSSAEMVREI